MTVFSVKVIADKTQQFQITFPQLLKLEGLRDEEDVRHFLLNSGEKIVPDDNPDLTLNLNEEDGDFFHDLVTLLDNVVDIH